MMNTVAEILKAIGPVEGHAMLWPHTALDAEACVMTLTHGGPEDAAAMAQYLMQRKNDIALAAEDPLRFGFEPKVWATADEQLRLADTVATFGGNRQSKSWWAAKRWCEAAWNYPGGTLIALATKEESSIAQQQKLVWHYLQSRIESFNQRRDTKFKINYTQAGGFTEGKVVLPNGTGKLPGTELYFLTYNQEALDYEGWEFGAPVKELLRRKDGSIIENIGWWADEDMPFEWLEVLTRRGAFGRGAKGLWTFTPVRGITPAVKEFIGKTPKVLRSAPAELLPSVNLKLEGCPRGHMPVVMEPFFKKARAVYFHIGSNPFGNYTQEVKDLCAGKSSEYVECVAYGYARDTAENAFKQFGPWNVVDEEQLPAAGTNFQIVDPAETRAWASTWVRVREVAGDLEYWFYRDWPDEQTYGEWAVPTKRATSDESTKGWDGDPGPAQWVQVDGVSGYKKLWRDLETLTPDDVDPYRVKLRANGINREVIEDRIIDSRAAVKPHMEELGQTSTVEQFDQEHADPDGGEPLEAIRFAMAKGDRIDLNMIRDALAPKRNKDGAIVKAPRLFVCRKCRQLIWALTHYTGRAGERGAAKDMIDLIRYALGADLYEVTPGAARSWRPGEEEEES